MREYVLLRLVMIAIEQRLGLIKMRRRSKMSASTEQIDILHVFIDLQQIGGQRTRRLDRPRRVHHKLARLALTMLSASGSLRRRRRRRR